MYVCRYITLWNALSRPYASGESVFLCVSKPNIGILDIRLNKSGLVVVLHDKNASIWLHLAVL